MNDANAKREIQSLPDVYQFGINELIKYLNPLIELGLKTILLFPVLDENDKGLDKFTRREINPVLNAIELLKKRFPDLILAVDVCLCTFALDGHCCVYEEDGRNDNEQTLNALVNLGRAYALLGVDILAPSTKNDSYVSYLKKMLISEKLDHISILAYGAKFASCLYGPFRNAANSGNLIICY